VPTIRERRPRANLQIDPRMMASIIFSIANCGSRNPPQKQLMFIIGSCDPRLGASGDVTCSIVEQSISTNPVEGSGYQTYGSL
jgi:hypothetical protein